MPRLILIRHGEAEHNKGQDRPLTDLGRAQAKSVAIQLQERRIWPDNFTGLVSPFPRCQETARIIADISGFSFISDLRIREWCDTARIGNVTYHHESPEDFKSRSLDFWQWAGCQELVIVSHQSPIALLLQCATGQPLNMGGNFWRGIQSGEIYDTQYAQLPR
jgi:broad specificity phosphatase PhoE